MFLFLIIYIYIYIYNYFLKRYKRTIEKKYFVKLFYIFKKKIALYFVIIKCIFFREYKTV